MTQTTHIPYGETHITLKIPKKYTTQILKPKQMKAIKDPKQEIIKTLQTPIHGKNLTELAENAKNPCIIVSDSTRPTPSRLIAETALGILNKAGIRDESVKIIIATGMHRKCTHDEIVEMLGENLLKRIKITNHIGSDVENLVDLGSTRRGTPILVNKDVIDSDLIIGDGYIEPHFFAGYTGGGKNILPGVCGLGTIISNHGAKMIDHPKSRAGILQGNPIYEDIVEGARIADYGFSVNVTLNADKQVSGVFSGDFEHAHIAGCEFLSKHVCMNTRPADIVITSNGGYPLDRDLYQVVKAMTVGEAAVIEGGVIIVASECRDGVGHPEFRKLVEESSSPQDIHDKINTPGFFQVDQWQAQTLARVLLRADVLVVSGGVDGETVRNMHMTPAVDLVSAMKSALKMVGRDPRISIIPGGPSTIPQIVDE